MRRLVALLAAVAVACGGSSTTTTTTDPRRIAALDYAASAERALTGTRFAEVDGTALADAILTLCAGTEAPAAGVPTVIAALEAPEGDPGDEVIMTEVLLTGVATVCPERLAVDPSADYLAALRAAVASAGGAVLEDATALAAGFAACDALDLGDPGNALVAIAAVGFGTETDAAGVLGGILGEAGSITAGAILVSAAGHLCPQHAERVGEYVETLGQL